MKIAIISIVCIALAITIVVEYIGTTNNQIIINPTSQNKTDIVEQIFIHSINPESNIIHISFGGLIISGERNFTAYLIIPGYGCQFFENGANKSGTNWYQLMAQINAEYPYFPIKPLIDNAILPTNTYYSDYFIILEGKPKVVYDQYLSLHPSFDETLARQNIWSVSEKVVSDSKDSIKGYCGQDLPYNGKDITILHHTITLSSQWEFVLRDGLYQGAILIPILLMWGHYHYMRKEDDITKQASLFMGIIVLFFTVLFGLQTLQSSGIISEIILIPLMALYSIMFVRILKRIKENSPKTTN